LTAGRKVNTLSQSWCTPTKYVDAIKEFFNGEIDLDPCSNDDSIVGAKVEYKLPDNDGLWSQWGFNKIYINPPYGRDSERKTTIKDWIRRSYFTHRDYGSEILTLIPVATNTSHWKEYIFGKAKAICFLYDTRLKFRIDGSEDNKGCPMACCIVYWGKDYEKFEKVFSAFGYVIKIK
jgi:hypothetical protein